MIGLLIDPLRSLVFVFWFHLDWEGFKANLGSVKALPIFQGNPIAKDAIGIRFFWIFHELCPDGPMQIAHPNR